MTTPDLVRGAAEHLIPREREVLAALADGLSDAEIVSRLRLSEATVTVTCHVARVLAELGVRDRAQPVVLAFRTGLVPAAGTRGR